MKTNTNLKLNEIFGNNVKYFRFKKKYSQEQLALLANLSVTYISQLELGQHTPSFDSLDSLAKALDVEPYDFFVKRNFKELSARVDMLI